MNTPASVQQPERAMPPMSGPPAAGLTVTPCPPAVTLREDMDGVAISLPPPGSSRPRRWFPALTFAAGLLGFAVPFFATLGLQVSLGLPLMLTTFFSIFNFVAMFSMMLAVRRLEQWHRSRLPRVRLTLTPRFIEIAYKRRVHRAPLSSLAAIHDSRNSPWQALPLSVLTPLNDQAQAVHSWTTETVDEWLDAHVPRQGSIEDVPDQLMQVSPLIQLKA